MAVHQRLGVQAPQFEWPIGVDVTVVRHERVIVPAGAYCAFKLESEWPPLGHGC